MPKQVDLAGLAFGQLTVVGRAGSGKRGRSLWRCHCACGTDLIVEGRNLTRGSTANKSCGCRRIEIANRQSKTCTKCHTEKPITEFVSAPQTQALDKRHSWCRDCISIASRAYREKNHDRLLAQKRAYQTANREALRERGNAWKAAHPERHRFLQRRSHLKRTYGLTPEQYDALAERQGGVCGLCATPSEERLHVDHDHACCPGKTSCGQCIRGLLCGKCNRLLGWYEKNYDRVEEYLCLSRS